MGLNPLQKLGAALNGKGLVGTAAKIATASNPVVGALVGAVGAALGTDERDPGRLAEIVATASGADVEKLREIEKDLVLGISADHVKIAQIEASDRADARGHRQLDKARLGLVMALLLIVPVMGAAIAVFDSQLEMSDMVLGAVVAAFGAIVRDLSSALSYFFGTSSGSADKARTIDRIVGK